MKEGVMKVVFLLAACMSILAVALICIFLFANGVPAIHKIGITEFLFGQTWKPSNNIYGIFPMIIGSIYVTAGAVIIGVPMGILCAIFLARFCPDKLYKIVKPAGFSACGDSFHCIWFLWSGCNRTYHAGLDRYKW